MSTRATCVSADELPRLTGVRISALPYRLEQTGQRVPRPLCKSTGRSRSSVPGRPCSPAFQSRRLVGSRLRSNSPTESAGLPSRSHRRPGLLSRVRRPRPRTQRRRLRGRPRSWISVDRRGRAYPWSTAARSRAEGAGLRPVERPRRSPSHRFGKGPAAGFSSRTGHTRQSPLRAASRTMQFVQRQNRAKPRRNRWTRGRILTRPLSGKQGPTRSAASSSRRRASGSTP